MIWLTSDSHFGHPGILKHQPARAACFSDTVAMDQHIIDQLNQYVQRNDELFHLGDFCWGASKAGHYRQRLNVRKLHLVRGNHDSSSLKQQCSTFQDMLCRKFGNQKIHMLHYPMLSWDALHYGGIHLYGHSHGRYETQLDTIFPGRRSMDVGIDNLYRLTGEWRPISLDEVLSRLNAVQSTLHVPGPFEATP